MLFGHLYSIQCNRHELGQTLGGGEGQRGLACCGPWGCKEPDKTERVNENDLASTYASCLPSHGAPRPSSIPGPYTAHLQATAPAPPSLLSTARLQRLPCFLQLSRQVFAPLRSLLPLTLPWKDKGLLHSLFHATPLSSLHHHTCSCSFIVCPLSLPVCAP